MRLQRTMALCGLVLTVTFGCLSPTVQSDRIDVVSNPELVKSCTPKGEGKYTAVGEKNALTLDKSTSHFCKVGEFMRQTAGIFLPLPHVDNHPFLTLPK